MGRIQTLFGRDKAVFPRSRAPIIMQSSYGHSFNLEPGTWNSELFRPGRLKNPLGVLNLALPKNMFRKSNW
jgi:hypothetical protein